MENKNFLIVTSFNQELYEKYAYKFMNTYTLPFHLHIYSETEITINKDISNEAKNFTLFNIYNEYPQFLEFVKRNQDKNFSELAKKNKKKIFKFDTIRFSYKVFSLIHSIENFSKKYNYIVWIDADNIFRKSFDCNLFKLLIDENKFMSYMGRKGKYSECGFLIFNTQNKYCFEYFNFIKNLYLSDEVYKLDETHDSFVWDHVRKIMENKYKDFSNLNITKISYNLLKNKSHFDKNWFISIEAGNNVLDRTILFLFMYHQKGKLKFDSNIPNPIQKINGINLEFDLNL